MLSLNNILQWHPDPGACAVDAFMYNWANDLLYAFPPFCVISRLLAKVANEGAEMVLIAPLWPTQPWFATLLRMVVDKPRLLPPALKLPNKPTQVHPMAKRLRLTAFRISGSSWKPKAYRETLLTLSCYPGNHPQSSSMGHISGNGCLFAVDRKLIHCIHL
jgi:hypothetical protein